MHSGSFSLPNNTDQLEVEVLKLRGAVKEKEQRIEQLLDYIVLLRKRQFGASADRPNKDQFNLFDEAELEQLLADLDIPDPKDSEAKAKEKTEKQCKKPVHRLLPAHFDRVEKIIDLSDEEKAEMGDDWTFIGYDTSEQLAVIPQQHYVIVYKCACWVHVRRKFVDATHGRKNTAAAHQMVTLIRKLYQVERAAEEKTAEARQAIRQTQATPILDKIKAWLDQKVVQVLPKSPLGEAITYTLGLWPKLLTYLEDGNIPIETIKLKTPSDLL